MRFRSGLCVMGVGLSLATPAAADYHVDRVTPVSGVAPFAAGCKTAGAENTPQIAADPRAPRHLVATYMQDAAIASVSATSRDGGRTWSRSVLGGMTPCSGGPAAWLCDPDLAIGTDGRVYATTCWGSDAQPGAIDHEALREYLHVAAPDATTFDGPLEAHPGGADQRGQLSPDPAHPGRVLVEQEHVHYVGGATYAPLPAPLSVYASGDGGETFGPGAQVPEADPTRLAFAIGLLRAPGSVVALSVEIAASDLPAGLAGVARVPEHVLASRSTDGGKTFGAPVAVGTFGALASGFAGCCIPDAAAGPDGTLYVTWPGPAADPGGVVVASSSDGGRTWRTTTPVHARGAAGEPAVAVRPDGRVGLFYYDVGIRDVTPMLAAAEGGTWTATGLAAPFDPSAIGIVSDSSAAGPYQDLVGLPDGFGVAVTVGGTDVRAGGTADVIYVHAAQSRP